MEDRNNKRKLYNALKQEGYDNFKDENDFNSYVEDSNNRKKLFNALKQEGYDNFKDETAFDTYLGYNIGTSSPMKQNDVPSTIFSAELVDSKIRDVGQSYTDQQYEAWSKLTPDVRKTLIGNTPYYDDVESRLSDDKLLEKAGVGPKVHPDSVISGGVALPTDANMVAERNYKDGVRRQLNQQIEESKQEANTLLGEVYNKDLEEKMKFQHEHPFLAAMMNMKTGRTGVDATHPRLVNEEAKNLHSTISKLDDAKDVLDESARKGKTFFFGGLLRGVGKSVLDVRTWDSGTSDMLDSGALLAAAQNKEAGRPLSHSQNLLLDAAAIDMAVDENFSGDLGRGYKAGRTTGESLPFMMEFMINPASGLGEATTKSIVKRGIQKYGKDAMKTTIKKIERGAMRAAADLAGAGVMSATTGSGRVVADTQERMLGNVQHEYDENGYVRYSGTDEGESLGTSLAKAYGASVIENYSEMLGNYFSPITDAITGVASRGLEKVGLSKVNKFIGDIKASDWGKAVADFEKRTHWNGNIGEYAEEVAGGIMNALVIGDQTLDTDSRTGVFNLDNNIDTLLGVSAIGGFLSGVRTIGYRTPKYKARKGLERADREAANVFGDDWTSVRESIENADENDIIPVLSSIFQSEEYKPEQKTAAIKYASSLKNYQGANLADLRRKTDGDVNEVQLQTENSYDNGYGLATPQERNDAKIALEGTIGKLIESYPDINKSEEDVISTINSYGNTPTDVLMYLSNGANGEYTKEYISQVTDFLNAKAQYDGMIANVKDGMEGEIETQMDYITKNTHKDGNVYNATMKVDDRRVYVTGGNIVVGEDGMIDHQKSEKSVIIRDAQTGKVDMVDVRDIQSIQPGLNAEQHKAQIAEQIKQDYVEKAATDINGVLPFNVGDSYTILNPETGMREDVMVQQAEGDLITIVGNDGKEVQTTRDEVQELVDRERMMRFDEQQQKDSSMEYTGKKVLEDGRTITPIASNDTEVAFDILDREGNLVDSDIMLKEEYEALPDYEEIPEEELDDDGLPIRPSGADNMLEMNLENGTSTPVEDSKMSEEPEEKVIDANNELAADGLSQETVTVPVQEDTNLQTMDTTGVQAQDVDQKPVIPVDEEGNPQYYKVPIETTIEDLTSPIVEEDGTVYEFTEEEVDGLIKVNKDEAIKRYEKLSGKPPKFVVNKVKYRAAKKQWTAQVADAKAQVDYWDEVEAQMKLLRQQPGDNTVEEIKAMGEPMNGEELAAMMLGAGKLPLLHSEYKRETGFGNTDASKMFGLFASKEKGGMTIEQAGEQLMLADLESGTNFFDQNDPNAGRNAIIDVLSSAQTRGGLIDYIKSNRDAMAERERRAEVEADELAKVQWYQDNYHMTPEEYELWEQGELLSESNVLSNDEKIEFYNTFADEILNEEAYDSRREQSDGQSIGTSEGNEQGGISGLHEGSHEVLQGEEPVSAGRAEGYQGEPAELAGQVDENLHSSDDGLQDSTSGRELNTSSESQEKVPEMTIPSHMEGESILDYASRVNDANILHKQEQRVDTQPTEAQKEAGNYRKGHIKIDGFDITIENPKGSERSGVDADGKPWSVTMNNTYGYIRGTEGVDGDHIDVFLGNSGNGVFVVDQVKEDGTFDEHKVMYGFDTLDEAKDAYLSNYSPGWKGLGVITCVSKETFKEWIDSSHRKTKPFADYKIVRERTDMKPEGSARNKQDNNIRFREEPSMPQEESEIINRAKNNGTYLMAPNGKPSKLTENQWVQVRTKAFKKWFGDWEKAARIEKLRNSNPVEISGEEYKGQYEFTRESAQQYILDNLRGEYTINDTGEKVKVSKKGAKKVTSHSQGNEAHMQSIVAIPELIGNSVFIEERPAYKDNAQYDSYRYYVTGLKIGGEDYTARITIGVKNGEFYYDHYLTDIEKGNLIEAAQSFKPTEDAPNPSYARNKDNVLFSLLQTNSSKVVDENGEPLVVFHGTPLRRDQITPNRGWQKDGITYVSQEAPFYTFRGGEYSGMIFTSVDAEKARSIAEKRAMSILDDENGKEQWTEEGYVYDLFANIKKPFVSSSDYELVLALFGNRIPTLSFIGGKGEIVSLNEAKSILKSGNSWLVAETPQFVEKIKEQGYDGLIGTDEGIKYIACFGPNQLKDAYDNTGEFSSENDDIRFREVKEKDGSKSLVGLHNISEEKLLKALNLGGFANPSAAVIDIDRQTHEGYGEISLVLPSALIEKRTGRNAGTWSTDAWTPTYPSVERSFKNNGSELLAKDLETMPEEMRLPIKRDFQNYMDGRDSDGLTYMFLYEKGVEPAIETVKNTYSDDIHKEVKEVTNNGTLSLFDLDKDGVKKIRDIYIKQEFGGDHNAFEESMKVLHDRWSSFLKEGNPNSFRYERFKQNLELMDEFGFDFSNVQSLISSVERDIDNSGKVDVGTTIKKAKTYVDENGLKGEFANWMESLNDRYGIEEVIFDGFTPSGKRRYIPNTLENVSKMMKKEGRNGATGIGVTFQNFAAGLLKAKASLKDIRAEKKKLTAEQTDVDEFRDKWSKVFYDLGEKLQSDAKEYDDYGLYRLAEAAQSNNPQKYIKNEYGIDFPDEDVKQLNEMIEAIRNEYPAMYFETKFERPVYLNEFAAAVLPDNVSSKVIDAARNAGLQVFSYKSGDEASRNEAIKKASDIDGVRFRDKETNHDSGAEGQGENNASIINHKQIESQVEKISSVLHSPVRMIRNIEELPDGMARKAIEEGRNIKGWYDTRTGEVMIYLPNITGEEEAKATFLHEIVGHKGLRALLGEKEYDNEMVKLYGQLPLKVRKMVADAAVLDYGGDVSIAMDEYLAEQAEKNETPLWWNKVVSAIRGLLRKMGLNMKLSANDVKYLLWRSRKNLERSNLLSVAEDVAIRYKLGIGEYDNSLFQERYEDIKEEIDHLREITGSNVYLARNEEELCFQMSVNGTDSKYIDYIRSLFERARGDGKKFPGLFDNKTGKIYLCADQINDRNKARGYWIHEEGHASTLSNFSRTELEMLYDSVGENRIMETLPSVYFEEKLSKSTLADEYISFLMEEIASDEELFNSLLEGNVDEVLEELEFPSIAVIPFISDNFKTILYGKEKNNNRESGLGNGLRALSGEKVGDGNVKQPEDARRESEEKSGSGRTDVGREREETEGEGVRFREVPTEEDSGEQKRPTLLEAYKKHILELNSRISSLERKIDTYVSAEDLTGEVIEEIKKEIGSDIISEIGKGELNSLMLQIKNAKTRKSLEKIFMNVKKIALAAQSRKLQRMLDKLLTLKVQDVNGKNMSIAKNVDESTRRVFSLIRGKLSDIKTSGLEDDILYLKRENRAAQEEIKRLERTIRDTDDAAVKDEAVSAIEKHKKTIEDNKGLIKELKDEKSELEKQIAGAADIDVEKEKSALEEKMDRAVQGKEVWTQGDTERMAALNIIGGQIMNKSHDFEIESIESDIRNLLSTNSNLHKDRAKEASANKRRAIYNAIKENRRQIVALERLINDTRDMQVKQLQMTIEQLEELILNGKNSLLRQTQEEVKRKKHIIGQAIRTVEGKPIDLYDKKSSEEIRLKKLFSAPLGSFEYMCKRVNTKTLGKDGFLYKYFVEGKEGVMKAYDTYILGMNEFRERLDEKSREIFGMNYEKIWSLSDKVVNESGVHLIDTGNGQRFGGRMTKVNSGYGVKYEVPLSKGQAMYVYQLWKMKDGRTKLELQGFDEDSIIEIRDFIGNDYIKFADWVQEELLPDLRDRYNQKYLEMFGTSMADIKDYVPIRIVGKSIRQESDLSEDKERKMKLEERAGSLIKRVVNIKPIDITLSAFDVLFEHGNRMEEWNAYARVRRDLDAVLSNNTFRNQLDANTRGSFHNFYDAAAVATKSYHPEKNGVMDEVIGKLSKGIVGGNIAWRLSTALKQILSAPAFWGYSQSPRYIKSLLANTSKMPVTFKWCMENIPSFKERVASGTVGNEKLEENGINKILDKYIETGMIPNKFVDAITCSIGAKSIFDYRYGQLLRQGLEKDAARNQALMDADIYYNQTQQSSHPAFLSPMQMGHSIVDRMFTTYQNSNIGYVRKVLAAYYDLTRSLEWKKLQRNYIAMYMEEGMSEDEAERKAYHRLLNENKKTAFEAILFAWGMNLLWNIGSQGLLGFFAGDGDDDDNLSKGISFFLTSPIKGMPGGNLLESIASGYGMNPLLVYDELDKFMKEIKYAIDDYGLFSPEIAYATMAKVSRYAGMDLEVLANIYLGVEGLARDGALDNDKMIDFMYLLNSPKSNRAAVAKELYKDETVTSFAEKVARAYKYMPKRDPWEGWVPGAKNLNKRRKKDIEKEYQRIHMTEEEKTFADEKKIADKHRRKLKELNDDPFELADYIDRHQKEHKIYQKYY